MPLCHATMHKIEVEMCIDSRRSGKEDKRRIIKCKKKYVKLFNKNIFKFKKKRLKIQKMLVKFLTT